MLIGRVLNRADVIATWWEDEGEEEDRGKHERRERRHAVGVDEDVAVEVGVELEDG